MEQTILHKIHYVIYFGIRYFFTGVFWQISRIKIERNVDSIKFIIKNHVSVSRFGDGEIALMQGHDTGFQQYNPDIAQKLKSIIKSNAPGHIVCLPYPWKNLTSLNYKAFEYWSSYLLKELRGIIPYLNLNKQYYDTDLTRFYIDYRNDSNARKVIPLLKRIWHNQDVYIVEGELSKLGIGNDLFNNAAGIHRILCPSTNAYAVYPSIISAVLHNVPKNALILIALGMTATCLAYDLHLYGYWAIDIGHVDIEYEWYRMKAPMRIPVCGKYTAEAPGKIADIYDNNEQYKSQIILKVS